MPRLEGLEIAGRGAVRVRRAGPRLAGGAGRLPRARRGGHVPVRARGATASAGPANRPRAAAPGSVAKGGAYLALLVAIGIGLHNLGEGLAIGSAYAVGALALGTFLVIGFALHNTTEGLAIVAPLAKGTPEPRDAWLRSA